MLVSVLGTMPYASNATLLAVDGSGRHWVYKPEQGENPLWDFPWRSLAAREVIAYQVSEAMGLGIVPETVMAEGPHGPGSAQAFLEEDPSFDPRTLLRPSLDPCLWPFAVFDLVANNADRKIGHMMREAGTGRLWGIDNGLTFHWQEKLRTVLWGFAGRPLPAPMQDAVARLQQRLGAGLEKAVASLLSRREATALTKRTAKLLANPIHPHPPEDRPPIPWPIW